MFAVRYLVSVISELTFSPLGFRWAHLNACRSVNKKHSLRRCWHRKHSPVSLPIPCQLCGLDMGREVGFAHSVCADYENMRGPGILGWESERTTSGAYPSA
jgi:hypothetical protein